MTKAKAKANSITLSTSTKSRATSNKAKSAAPKAIPKRKSNSSTSASPLFTGHEGAELRRRVDRFFDKPKGQASPGPATTYPAAYREAVRGKKGIVRETEDVDEGDDEEAADDDDDAGREPGEEGIDEGDEDDGEGQGEDGVEDEPEQGEELLLDDDEETEMRTVKGKSKGKETAPAPSTRALRFGGLIMMDRPFPTDGKLSKPSATAIKALEAIGLAAFDTDGFVIPAHATHEEVDQTLGEILPTPIDYLRSRLDGDEDTPVWELIKAEYRNLYRIKVARPAANHVRATWGDGRSIAAKVLFICPTFPFPKKVLSNWRAEARSREQPSNIPSHQVSMPRKRKHEAVSKPEDDENRNDTDHENRRMTKKLRIMSPVDDSNPEQPRTPHKPNTRSAAVSSQLLDDGNGEGSSRLPPLRERQGRMQDMSEAVFLLSSPDKEFDPYANPNRYFGGL